jgi:hypothetical protein
MLLCDLGLWWKMVMLQWKEQATFNVVMSHDLIIVTYGPLLLGRRSCVDMDVFCIVAKFLFGQLFLRKALLDLRLM